MCHLRRFNPDLPARPANQPTAHASIRFLVEPTEPCPVGPMLFGTSLEAIVFARAAAELVQLTFTVWRVVRFQPGNLDYRKVAVYEPETRPAA